MIAIALISLWQYPSDSKTFANALKALAKVVFQTWI